MYISPFRLATMAAALVVAVAGGAWVGRITAPSGPGGPAATPSASASAAPDGLSLDDYRSAHNAICVTYASQIDPFMSKLSRIYDPTLPAADRAIEVDALTNIVALTDSMLAEIRRLDPPASIAVERAVYLSNYQHITALIRLQFPLLAQGAYADAERLDVATGPSSSDVEAFEQANGLTACP